MDVLVGLIALAFAVGVIIGYWRMFEKAAKPGWAIIIPIYNVIVLLQIAGKPWWWILLLIVPVLNFIIIIITFLDLAKAFGQGALFAIGMILFAPIFVMIIGLSDMKYVGINAAS